MQVENSGRSGDREVRVDQGMRCSPEMLASTTVGPFSSSNTATPMQTGAKTYVNCKVHCAMKGTSLPLSRAESPHSTTVHGMS